ncbi:pirin family protein [Cyanobacterium stanieri LEGE 03274]|uniref:Pirin family protein n=1 Tax=Cyanobacterium stanieri LEGE 03274 TaxID=1828756 RepID=A0ABR9UZN6_9CHRO|nr:pirin family protein [Cyanobacterium stanieri]MBE9221103.1 pirin family protein [Cyanobacterium stanieri LEGE 03274]
MITIRPSAQRGHVLFDWLNTKHTFSFGSYYDPQYTGFGNLLVINEDKIAPAGGFGTHGHRDMEIVTYVIEGELEHKDSIGNGETISRGEVQRMSAGTGIRHSEFNHSSQNEVHLLQIWILPNQQNLEPSYEQKIFSEEEKRGKLCLLVSPDGENNSLKIHQNVNIWSSILGENEEINYSLGSNDYAWIQLVKGQLDFNNNTLNAGDGVAIREEDLLTIKGNQNESEFLLFHFLN